MWGSGRRREWSGWIVVTLRRESSSSYMVTVELAFTEMNLIIYTNPRWPGLILVVALAYRSFAACAPRPLPTLCHQS